MPVHLDDQQELEVDADDLCSLVGHVLLERGVDEAMDVSVLLVDESTMADLNHLHLGGRGPTDVLAFPIDEPGSTAPDEPAVLGEVVLCPRVVGRQAAEHGRGAADELRMLTVHGLLHLLGMDHAEPAAEREMFGLTDELLAGYADRVGP